MMRIMLIAAMLWLLPMHAKTTDENLKIYIDCGNNCDMPFFKQNLKYVEFVRDQKFADINILFRSQRTGGGGLQFEIEFTGQNDFDEIHELMIFSTNEGDTDIEVRDLIFSNLKVGLVRYWVKNGMDHKIKIQFKSGAKTVVNDDDDPWNKWVFNMRVSGRFNGEESRKSEKLNFRASAKRVTDKNKIYLSGSIDNNSSTYNFDGENILSHNKSTKLYLYDVISINEHWSAGLFAYASKSTYSNYSFNGSLKPAVEYNIFPYTESSEKQLTLSYKIGGVRKKYVEKTIFEKLEENVWEHGLDLGGSIKQKWGYISGEVSYDSFLHDSELNAFRFFLGTSFRIVKGLSLDVSGNYGISNNQINLAAADLSLEELLLRQQQVKSGYYYYVNTGLSYSFGSIYNSIVNPRFKF